MNIRAIKTKPNKPPIYDSVSSIFLKPRSTIIAVLDLLNIILAKILLSTARGTA